MKKVLIVHPGPFGYHTGTYYFVSLLRDKYDVTYLGIDEGKPSKNIEGVKFIHVSTRQGGLKRRISYFKSIKKELNANAYDFVLINYFIFCSIIAFFFSTKNMLVEVRSSYIFQNKAKRLFYNAILVLEVRFFKNICTLSDSLKKYLFLPKRTHIVPLGSPLFPKQEKKFSNFNVFYIGTFYGRNIHVTLEAFAKFCKLIDATATYTIVGFGSEEDVSRINLMVKELKMERNIFYKGAIRFPELNVFFEENNIGMSYIPILKKYNSQPATKTFEYLLSGMPVLATATLENKLVINDTNGVLTGDTVEDIYQGLKKIYERRSTFDSIKIQAAAKKYSWESIVDNILVPFIEKISKS